MSGAVPWNEARAHEIITAHLGLECPVLPVLHALQKEFGYLSAEAISLLAKALNISRAEMYGVITFYDHFRIEPPGRHELKLCRAEACRSMGSEKVAREFLDSQHLDWRQTAADNSLTVDAVYCLGLCAHSPAALYDGDPIGRVDAPKLAALAQEAKSA
ncbi:MAG: NAD(P)H-dependent oxidoreductase subunit E [Methylocystis sp.]|nr:NAD(P)H-dependent oxidoreductase subunit E [Methylocystis sp.]MBI3275436.1 NAD(P)H-dependent oxidoreductase subunit E [Methylocystis sp.]